MVACGVYYFPTLLPGPPFRADVHVLAAHAAAFESAFTPGTVAVHSD